MKRPITLTALSLITLTGCVPQVGMPDIPVNDLDYSTRTDERITRTFNPEKSYNVIDLTGGQDWALHSPTLAKKQRQGTTPVYMCDAFLLDGVSLDTHDIELGPDCEFTRFGITHASDYSLLLHVVTPHQIQTGETAVIHVTRKAD